MENKRIYLACPYSHSFKDVRKDRAKFATQVTGRLMKAGLIVYSPITHGHGVAVECGLPGDCVYWSKNTESFICWCTDIFVVCIPGWQESGGVQEEIFLAEKMGKNLVYLRPGNYFFDGFFSKGISDEG